MKQIFRNKRSVQKCAQIAGPNVLKRGVVSCINGRQHEKIIMKEIA